MMIRKVAVGNSDEAFIEENFANGVNIISSDDNNKGKTIVIQSMMYALGNEPTFPTSFEFQKYYYYIEFEEAGITFKLCRSGDGFVLKRESAVLIFDNVSELKRYWNRNIFPLPSIVKNQLLRIVDPVLYVQLFFVGQDKKDTSNIANRGFYNKQDFIEMLYAFAGLTGEQLPQEKIDEIKSHISALSDEKKLLLQQHKILKSKKAPVSYLSAESDRLAFGKKIASLEKVQSKIAELRKARNNASTRKSKWEHTINELRSLNRTISCGELRCMDCNSTNISFSTGEPTQTSYSFDVSTVEMRNEIINSISEKISAYSEEIERLSAEIVIEQERLQSLMDDESVSLESIVAYKKDIFSASEAEARIKEIDTEVATLKSQLLASENASLETQEQRTALLSAIIGKMNELYHQIDPDGNITYSSLFTQRNEVYSGSEATIFHVVKLFALQFVLRHSFPIVIDSFRAEDLSTGKENTVLEISKSIGNQVILTTTLKHEEIGKYDDLPDVNHINYQSHTPSKILDGAFVKSFIALLKDLSIEI